jgi:uncharacterized protein (DUF1786 family)
MAAYFLCADTQKPSIAGGRIDTENDSAVFIHDAANEHITVGGDIRHRRQMFHHEWGKIPRACLEKYIINRINNCRKRRRK